MGVDDDAGIVAEVQLTSGQKTTVNIDNLEFKDLKDLAGRGVAICSEVTYDSAGFPSCKEPYYSCCSLKWDNKEAALAQSKSKKSTDGKLWKFFKPTSWTSQRKYLRTILRTISVYFFSTLPAFF